MTKFEHDALRAIEKSKHHGIIVNIPWSQQSADLLSLEGHDNGSVMADGTEFWGEDEEGNTWRVHLIRNMESE